MRAIILENSVFKFGECARPEPKDEDVLIKVAYAGVNRADLFQQQGRYPLPNGFPPIPGMEVSGEAVVCGRNAANIRVGDRVCALLTEGGYAEYVAAPAPLTLPVPETLTMEEAAGLPEACFTAWTNLIWQARLQENETVLVHGGASGIGHMIIQIAASLGARVYATAGNDEKCAFCVKSGAAQAINYTREDFAVQIKSLTGGKGVDIIIDIVGGDYFDRNLECLAYNGRLCLLSFLRGSKVSANISGILIKCLCVSGSTLRSRSLTEKIQIALELKKNLWHKLGHGRIRPVIHSIFPLDSADKALACMEQGLNIGKILIKM
jgi:putative PIG3 family NAD(P)H quinone oxidoreductase